MHTEMTRFKFKRPDIKPLAERNRFAVGLVGIAVLVAVVVAAFSYDKIPFVKGTSDYSAYFAEAGGIKPGSDVRVSGMSVGRVSDVQLEGTKVLVDFTVRNGVELGDRTEAAIKAETVLGTKMLEITPRGDGELTGTIPLERTKSPYDLPTALGDLTTTISALDTTQLSSVAHHVGGHLLRHPARAEDRAGRRGAVLRHAQHPRCAAAQPARRRQQGHRGAWQAQRSDRQPGRQHQRPAGRDSVATRLRSTR